MSKGHPIPTGPGADRRTHTAMYDASEMHLSWARLPSWPILGARKGP